MKRIKLQYMEPEQVTSEIAEFIANKASRFGTGGIIGLSGGVDSTLAAACAKIGFDTYNKSVYPNRYLELVGYMLPSIINSPKDAEDGISVAERLGISYEVISIEPLVDAYRQTIPDAFESDYDAGNLMSRIRGNVLNTKSATQHKVLIGTGNKDEDFGIGYYTLFGDGAVHLSPIGGLPKRLVYELASFLGFPDIAAKTPTAGLELGQTDFKDLGYGYDAVEIVVEGLSQRFSTKELYVHPQVQQIIKPQLAITQKYDSVAGVVDNIQKRHHIALAKAQVLHPEIAPVTLVYR